MKSNTQAETRTDSEHHSTESIAAHNKKLAVSRHTHKPTLTRWPALRHHQCERQQTNNKIPSSQHTQNTTLLKKRNA